MALDKEILEALYSRCNHRAFVHPDPLEFLYNYEDLRDREIVGLIASSLAYGRVSQILRSVESVLRPMGDSPAAFLLHATPESLLATFGGFKHRFTDGREISALLASIGSMVARYGSLENCFNEGFRAQGDIMQALDHFARELRCEEACRTLIPSPRAKSACKRLHLFLRWMVRRDEVDPGGWESVKPVSLIVPLDTHMFNICRSLGLTSRSSASLASAIEITEAFRAVSPEDPVKYDFSLTRLGIRSDMDIKAFILECGLLDIYQPKPRDVKGSSSCCSLRAHK